MCRCLSFFHPTLSKEKSEQEAIEEHGGPLHLPVESSMQAEPLADGDANEPQPLTDEGMTESCFKISVAYPV